MLHRMGWECKANPHAHVKKCRRGLAEHGVARAPFHCSRNRAAARAAIETVSALSPLPCGRRNCPKPNNHSKAAPTAFTFMELPTCCETTCFFRGGNPRSVRSTEKLHVSPWAAYAGSAGNACANKSSDDINQRSSSSENSKWS